VTHPDLLHACSIKCANSKRSFWKKVIQQNFLKFIKWLLRYHTVIKVKELWELSKTEIKMVGQPLSFSDNGRKLKFGGPFCGPLGLSW